MRRHKNCGGRLVREKTEVGSKYKCNLCGKEIFVYKKKKKKEDEKRSIIV